MENQKVKTEADLEALKAIEEELRNTVAELLAEIKRKEEDANATAEELKESVSSLTDLLRSKQEQLTAQAISSSKLAANNTVLTDDNEKAAQNIAKVQGEIAAEAEARVQSDIEHSKKVAELNFKIECLIEQNKSKCHHGHC